MGRLATTGVPVLVEHGRIRIQTTRLSRAAFPLREGPRSKPAAQRAWAHAHLPDNPRHRQRPAAAGRKPARTAPDAGCGGVVGRPPLGVQQAYWDKLEQVALA